MAIKDQLITKQYALYNGDCVEVMRTFPDESIDLSIYSPPFCGLYNYSSDDRDLSNCKSYEEFFEHYEYVVSELYRLTKPGRSSAVHCMDISKEGANISGLIDFPGDIIRLHQKIGFEYWTRKIIWKDALQVRNRTMAKGLAHKQIVDDSSRVTGAGADYLLQFRKKGDNQIPVEHPVGLLDYAGSRRPPSDVLKYRGHKGDQKVNKYSHWIWQKYASSNWYDIRINEVLPYEESKENDDEPHVHPLQLDVIERACVLWSNPGEIVLSPFSGVGSEIFGAIKNSRKGIGIELKPTYFKQSCRNMEEVCKYIQEELKLL